MMSLYPSLKAIGDSAFLRTRSVDSIVAVLRHGAGRDMKSFADRLSPDEIAAVAKFVKTLASDSTHAP
jgi:mono/diheme cytochrome c family protein